MGRAVRVRRVPQGGKGKEMVQGGTGGREDGNISQKVVCYCLEVKYNGNEDGFTYDMWNVSASLLKVI